MPTVSTRPRAGTAVLRCGQMVNISEDNLSGLLVRPEVALKQHQAEIVPVPGAPAVPPDGFCGLGAAFCAGRAASANPRSTAGAEA